MKNTKRFNVCCVSDEKYIQLLKPFLKSLHTTNPNAYTYVTLVNCPERSEEILDIHRNVNVLLDTTTASTKRTNLDKHGIPLFDNIFSKKRVTAPGGFNGAKYLLSNMSCYCSNIRYRTVLEQLDSGKDPIIFMDVDAIIRGSLDDLVETILANDITIMKESRGFNSEIKYISEKYAPDDNIDWHCGIIGVKNNKLTREIFKKLRDRTESDMFNWDADQEQFNIMYKEYADRLNLGDVTHRYKDEGYKSTGYSENSIIWCGAGEQKYSNKQYIQEQNKWT